MAFQHIDWCASQGDYMDSDCDCPGPEEISGRMTRRDYMCPKCKKLLYKTGFKEHLETHDDDVKRYEGDSW